MEAIASQTHGNFLLQFQEEHSVLDQSDVLCATATMTKTIEDPDQDPTLLATQTMTETSEAPDQDPPRTDYFAIPRA